jgi:hypothetical protein
VGATSRQPLKIFECLLRIAPIKVKHNIQFEKTRDRAVVCHQAGFATEKMKEADDVF